MAIDTVATGVPEGPLRELARCARAAETELLAELPGDAWGAMALPEGR